MANEVAVQKKIRYPICGIYMLINDFNGKQYIGQSIDIERRYMEHKTPKATGSKELHDDMQKYGVNNFTLIILNECEREELDRMEIDHIRFFNPEYNKCAGGKGSTGHIVSDSVREKCRQGALKQWETMDEHTRNRILGNLTGHKVGYVMSDETKKKISKNRSGIPRKQSSTDKQKETMRIKKENGYVQTNKGHKKKVICVTTGEVFDSVLSAGENYKINPSSISAVLNGRQKATHGLNFIYGGKE